MAPLVRRNVGQKCRALNNKALAARNVARTTAARNAPEKAAGARRSLQKQHKFVKPTVADTRSAVVCASGTGKIPAVVNAAAASPPAPEWKGANLKNLGLAVAVGTAIWFCPTPAGITSQAWHLLAIFVATIIGIITAPLPLGAVAMIGLCASMMTKTLTFAQAFAAFSNQIPWLIAIAFFLAKGFIKTGLGTRIAYYVVSIFGSTTLGLTYSLVFSEALLAPAIPSLAARAGGIFLPLAKALCVACGSDPENGTEKKMGSYLMKTFFQGTCISSAMFITAMAANPLSVNLAAATIGITISWTQWAVAAFVPGFFCLVTMPLILYIIYPPEVKDSPEAPKKAKEELAKLGDMGRDEKIMAVSLLSTVAMWVFGASYGINAVAAALSGLTILLVTGVISWKECLMRTEPGTRSPGLPL
jgi:anion transporter